MTPDKSLLDDFGIFSVIQTAKYEPPSRATLRKYDRKYVGIHKGISELNVSLYISFFFKLNKYYDNGI
jgi:hypothetical protein